MTRPQPANKGRSQAQRTGFTGRIQEQRQFRIALQGLLAHQRRWRELEAEISLDQAPPDDSYAHVFLLHGSGGIGKSWLTRRCLALTKELGQDPPILTLYDDVSAGLPALEPGHFLDRIAGHLVQAGYPAVLAPYRQMQADPSFSHSPAALAAKLVTALKRVARQSGLVIALDNLEAIVPLEPFVRDELVLPTTGGPIIWLLNSRHNLADERQVEVAGEQREYKGYRDLLDQNPPLVWEMSLFGDADLRKYLQSEVNRRRISLTIDDELIDTVKSLSNGLPLAVAIITDALFYLGRESLERNFALANKNLSPAGRLEQLTTRFLRHCLADPTDLERIQALALLHRGASEAAIQAIWALLPGEPVREIIRELNWRYALLPAQGLHDVIYEFVRRDLKQQPEARARLSRRAISFYEGEWNQIKQELSRFSPHDPTHALTHPRWQQAARNLLNALLWADPGAALPFFLPRFVENLVFARPWAEALLTQMEEFLASPPAPPDQAYFRLLQDLRQGLREANPFLARPSPAVGWMVDTLLQTAELEPLHLSILHLSQGNWFIEQKQYPAALAAYLTAEAHLPPAVSPLQEQLGQAFYELSRLCLWPEAKVEPVASGPGLQAAQHAVKLIPAHSRAWFNLGVALELAGQNVEAVPAYQQAIELEAQPVYYQRLGAVYTTLARDEEAAATYRRLLELEPENGWTYHHLALIETRRAAYEPALNLYRQAIERHQEPEARAEAWFQTGQIYQRLGRYEQAIAAYQQATEVWPAMALSWHRLGEIYTTLHRYKEAIPAYRRVTKLEPANCSAWEGLAEAYSTLGRYREAGAVYEQLIKLEPREARFYDRLGFIYEQHQDHEAALAQYQQAVRYHQQNQAKAVSWNKLGQVYLALNNYRAAVKAYLRASRLDPAYVWPYQNLAAIYEQCGKYQKAIVAYQAALVRHDHPHEQAVMLNQLGNVYQALCQPGADQNGRPAAGDQPGPASAADYLAQAVAAYRQASNLDPTYAWPYHNLGVVFEAMADYDQALIFYQQAIERHRPEPEQARSWYRLGQIQARLGRYQQAVEAHQAALQFDPGYSLAWHSLGDTYAELGQNRAAISAYKRAMKLDPAYAWPYHKLGLIYDKQGDHAQAATLYQQALERHQQDSDRALTWHKLGQAYQALGQPEQAVAAYQQAIALEPTFLWPYHHLGAIYEGQGNYEQALSLYEQAMKKGLVR